MNQRQRKKFHKKLCKKKYINYRESLIIKTISERYGGFEVGGVVITDTRKMNLKHPLRIHYTIRCNLPDSKRVKVLKTIESQPIDTNVDGQSLRSMAKIYLWM